MRDGIRKSCRYHNPRGTPLCSFVRSRTPLVGSWRTLLLDSARVTAHSKEIPKFGVPTQVSKAVAKSFCGKCGEDGTCWDKSLVTALCLPILLTGIECSSLVRNCPGAGTWCEAVKLRGKWDVVPKRPTGNLGQQSQNRAAFVLKASSAKHRVVFKIPTPFTRNRW